MPDTKKIEEKKRFAGAKKPSMKRRSGINNYHGRHIYMLTLAVEGRRPLLGTLEGGEEKAWVQPTPLGREVVKCWAAIPRYHSEVKLLAFQLMPDHLHGLLFVTEAMEEHLGQVVSGFKAGCNKAYRKFLGEGEGRGEAVPRLTQSPLGAGTFTEQSLFGKAAAPGPGTASAYAAAPPLPLPLPSQHRLKPDDKSHGLLFERGYNDLIAKGYDMLPRMSAYVKDNPRRLAVKRAHPDYFRVRFGLQTAGQQYAAIGNRFLLQHPEKVQVQLSRSLTDEQIQSKKAEFLALARQGAVLVSPAISRGEQAVMRAALDEHLPLIFLTPWGFNEFSKPGHQYYEACADGRFLILAPWEHQNERIPLTRTMCLTLNEMTKQICEL
ncbi:MAG: hypothetical protein II849_07435 [Bacteroidales bacterium]|nr:hypothetical protein [Bacteroidales bacterium]